MLGMGRIEATSLAYERSVLATNPGAARGHSNVCYSITNWSFPLVRGSDSRRLPPASEALASTSKTCWRFTSCLSIVKVPQGSGCPKHWQVLTNAVVAY